MSQGNTEAVSARRPLNLKQLAAYLHLSQTTVSLVLNNSPAGRSIPQHTRDRVLEAARKFHYRPNYFARSLRNSRSMSVGVIVPDLSDGYFPEVMNAVELRLLKADYFYVTVNHYRRPEVARENSVRLMNRSVDGLLLLDTDADIHVPIPVVAISSHNRAPGIVNIVLDHDRAAQLALGHLRDLGHERIVLMKGPPGITDAGYRWESIVRTAAEMGIPVLPELCIHMQAATQSPEAAYLHMRELLARTRDFTAVFCFNDIAAIGAMRALRDAKLRIPEDVSVVGFDDIMTAAYCEPALTTVKQPLEAMGAKAAEILLARIEAPDQEHPIETVMEPQLMVRESTGPAAGARTSRKEPVELAEIQGWRAG